MKNATLFAMLLVACSVDQEIMKSMDITRELQLLDENGATSECRVRFFGLRQTDGGPDWEVSFSVLGAEWASPSPRAVYGVDPLQAFLGALTVARAYLESSHAHREGRLRWLGSSDLGLGTEAQAVGR